MVEVGAPVVEALAAQELHAGSVAGDGEGEGLPLRFVVQPVAGDGVDGYLVGDRPQCCQRAAAPDHDARVRFLDHREGHVLVQDVRRSLVAAALQVHQRVGQRDVVLPDELVVVEHVLLELGAVQGVVARRTGPSREYGVHEVGRPAHHAAAGPSPARHHFPPPHQVVDAPGHEERQADGFAGGGRGEGHLLPQRGVMLHIVERRNRAHAVAQGGVLGNILYALPVQPHLRGRSLRPAMYSCPVRAGIPGHLPDEYERDEYERGEN